MKANQQCEDTIAKRMESLPISGSGSERAVVSPTRDGGDSYTERSYLQQASSSAGAAGRFLDNLEGESSKS